MVKNSDDSCVLDKGEMDIVKAALRFALDMSDTYYSFSPKLEGEECDYSDGNAVLCSEMEEKARDLLADTI